MVTLPQKSLALLHIDDCVISVPKDRHAVRNEVDRNCEIDKEEPQTNAHPDPNRSVGRQPAEESDRVRQDSHGLSQQATLGSQENERDD